MINNLLEGKRVLVCRPEPSASELSAVLSSVGATVQTLPTIEVEPLEVNDKQRSYLFDLDQYEKVIVVSQHAAHRICELIDEIWPQPPYPQRWFGIGRKTSEVLQQNSLDVMAPESDMSSEALLETPELQEVKGQKILIAKGRGGRSKLEQGLRDRGAKVQCIDLYQRKQPNYSDQELTSAFKNFQPDAIICLSTESLDNLHALTARVEHSLLNCLLVLPSERTKRHAKTLGYLNSRISDGLRPIDLIKTLTRKP